MVMRDKLLKIFLIIGLLMLMVSCGSMSTLNLDVLRPADVTIDPEILSVAIVNNSLPYRGKNVHTVKTPKGTGIIDTLWIDDFPKIAAASMADALRNKQFFNEVYYHDDVTNIFGQGNLSEYMLKRKIENICYMYDVQAVIVLENYLYKTKLTLMDLGDIYYGSMDVNGGILWKIYEQNGNLLDQYFQNDSIFWDAAETRYSAVLNQLPRQIAATEVLAEYLGETYIRRTAPYWETVSRKYYSKGHFLFLRANDLHAINNWSEAAKVWYNVYENGNKRQKAISALNIALSYEVRGDFDEAVAWCKISQRFFENLGGLRVSNYERKIVTLYNLQLIERQQQKKKLDEQIGEQN